MRGGPNPQRSRLAIMGLEERVSRDHMGSLMDFTVNSATGTAEWEAVPELLDGVRERDYRPRPLGTHRGYDTKDCVRDIRA